MKHAVKMRLDELQKQNVPASETVNPVIEEKATAAKEVVETGKVVIRKSVRTELVDINIPLVHEGYEIDHVPSGRVVDSYPAPWQEGDTMIIPIVKEILVIEKKYQVVEEVHVRKTKTSTPFVQQIDMKNEQIKMERKKQK